jgi:competence protein ComEA
MPDPEVRALRRAVVVLLMLSMARWIQVEGGTWDDPAPGAKEVTEATRHAARTRAAVEADRARSRPLAEGETLDPNEAGPEVLDRLPGVGPSLAQAIVELRATGARFRRPEDLLAVRGLGPAALERMRAHLVFSPREAGVAAARPRTKKSGSGSGMVPPPLDLNAASTAELMTLPGIGAVIAERVVKARRDRPFVSLEDLARVPGIGPVTVEGLRGLVTVDRHSRWP